MLIETGREANPPKRFIKKIASVGAVALLQRRHRPTKKDATVVVMRATIPGNTLSARMP
jgi:hypothetical protein